jgi:hypothetical protein
VGIRAADPKNIKNKEAVIVGTRGKELWDIKLKI